ncbi:MAG: hypothetical protein DMG61_07450 [Acidobacteria bacterium]|nr:MAG: hypothetical protein DMG61_07450 [Acidobacteriota bacterium]
MVGGGDEITQECITVVQGRAVGLGRDAACCVSTMLIAPSQICTCNPTFIVKTQHAASLPGTLYIPCGNFMTLFRGKYRVESARLAGYDYRAEGWYFVTICTKDKLCVFGDVYGFNVNLTRSGEIAHTCWQQIPQHHRGVQLDQFIVMPNHVHGIVILEGRMDGPSLGQVVRSYKSGVLNQCRRADLEQWRWQTRFYDEILKDADAVGSVRTYIRENPINWDTDPEHVFLPVL